MVTYISRSEWGARPPKNITSVSDRSGGFVVHYTTRDAQFFTHDDCAVSWRSHQDYHMDVKGWSDLAYNFGVCPHGFVFVGRGWDARNGANSTANYNTLSICVDADDNDPIDESVYKAINAVIQDGLIRGWGRRVRKHKDVSSTQCPGPILSLAVDSGVINLEGDDDMAWLKPGDLVVDRADAAAVFAYQGSVAAAADVLYNPTTIREANERLWIIAARMLDILMRQDQRIGSHTHPVGVPGPHTHPHVHPFTGSVGSGG